MEQHDNKTDWNELEQQLDELILKSKKQIPPSEQYEDSIQTVTGRPTSYKPEYAKQAEKLAQFGHTDKELASFFSVSERTLNRWKLKYSEFCHSLKTGKHYADERVERALYQRAVGYDYLEEKIVTTKGAGGKEKTHVVRLEKHQPSDVTAAIFWLKNRRPKEWRDSKHIDHSAMDGSRTPVPHVIELVAPDVSNKFVEDGEANANDDRPDYINTTRR